MRATDRAAFPSNPSPGPVPVPVPALLAPPARGGRGGRTGRSGSRRVVAWLLALPLLLAALVLGGAGAVSAHAVLESSNPANGATLTSAPAQVALRFSEGVEIGLGGVKVFDPGGKRVDTNQSKHGPVGDTSVVTPLRGGL